VVTFNNQTIIIENNLEKISNTIERRDLFTQYEYEGYQLRFKIMGARDEDQRFSTLKMKVNISLYAKPVSFSRICQEPHQI